MGIESEKLKKLTESLFADWKTDAKIISEADTKVKYIERVLECLGWDRVDNMRREKIIKASGTKPDCILHADGIEYLAVETKPIKHRLGSKDAVQSLQYGLNTDIAWCLVTQGYFYEVYNVFWRFKPEAKLFFKTSLMEATENFSRFLYKINLISKESMVSKKIDKIGKAFYRRQKIQKLLSSPPDELIHTIRGLPGHDDLNNEDIIESLKELIRIRLKYDTCPLCDALERGGREVYEHMKERGGLKEGYKYRFPLLLESFQSWEDLEEHMKKKHSEALDLLLYIEKD